MVANFILVPKTADVVRNVSPRPQAVNFGALKEQ
jgi:hypothetical protein